MIERHNSRKRAEEIQEGVFKVLGPVKKISDIRIIRFNLARKLCS